MYKSIITFVAAALILTACNSQDAANQNTQTNGTQQQQLQETTDVNQEPSDNQEPGDNQESSDNQEPSEKPSEHELEQTGDTNSNAQNDKWSTLEEYETILSQIEQEDYTFKTVTDNDNNRILLLEKDGVSKYKTIYVKNTGRLKIISLDGDKQIFNEVLAAK